jgi:asparagine synthase (glutamine-hydrolysing)
MLPATLIDRWIPTTADRLPRLRRTKRAVRTLAVRNPARRYAGWLELFTPEMRRELLLRSANGYDPAWAYPKHYEALDTAGALNRMMYVDLKTWLPDVYLEKTDKASMAASLEVRLPFLDHRLVQLAFEIPGSMKVQGCSTKRILRDAVRGLIPDSVLRRPKHGFAVPTDPWFRGPAKEYAYEILLDGRARSRGYFNADVVERMWKEHVNGRHVWDTHLWLLLNFELWHRRFLDP